MSRMLDGRGLRPPALVGLSARSGIQTRPARRESARRERRRECPLVVGLFSLERQLVGIERALHGRSHAGRSGIGRSAVQRWQRDMLLVDGHARILVSIGAAR